MKDAGTRIELLDASVSDAAELLAVQKLAFRGQAELYHDFTLPPLVQTLDELIADFDKHVVLKASHNGAIVGSVRGQQEGDTCHLSRLVVHPGYQNQGIGKMLMQAIEKRFSNAARYELFTGHKSEKNLALYRSLGYHEFSRRRQSDAVTLVCMEKRKT
jgi:ribosomal protein S18 acetylase RimI-like enzyme